MTESALKRLIADLWARLDPKEHPALAERVELALNPPAPLAAQPIGPPPPRAEQERRRRELHAQMEEENKVKDRCPYCGQEFEDYQIPEEGKSTTCTRCGTVSARDELIGCWDDCAWDY